MNKISVQDLVPIISKKHGITQKEAGTFVSTLFEIVVSGLETDRQVKIKGLGTFKVIEVRDRESVNVNTGERIVIDGRGKITFTPDAVMRDLVNRPFAQFETVVINDGVDMNEFELVDKRVEEMQNAGEQGADKTVIEDETGDDGGMTVPVETSSSEKSRQYDVSEGIAVQPYVSDDYAEDTENINNPDMQETIEDVPMYDDEVKSDSNEEPEDEYTGEECTTGGMLKKVLLFVFLLLFISGGAAYMGYYFGQKSASDDKKLVLTATPPVEKTEKDIVGTRKDSTKADTVKIKQAEDTISGHKSGDINVAVRKDANKPVAVKRMQTEPAGKGAISDRYDRDNVMVRTGAYRIVGVERTVTLRKGQTLSSVSKAILGPGMECYIEALNGVKEAKEGQTLKIPKLELRKKKRK